MLLAEISQNWAVVPIVLGAVGYLLVAWRRSTKGRGGCCGHASSCMPSLSASDQDQGAAPRPKQFVDAGRLAGRAKELRQERDDRAAASR